MFLQPWSPFRELRHFNRAANRQWRGYPRYVVSTQEPDYWSLAVDVVEADDALRVTASSIGVAQRNSLGESCSRVGMSHNRNQIGFVMRTHFSERFVE